MLMCGDTQTKHSFVIWSQSNEKALNILKLGKIKCPIMCQLKISTEYTREAKNKSTDYSTKLIRYTIAMNKRKLEWQWHRRFYWFEWEIIGGIAMLLQCWRHSCFCFALFRFVCVCLCAKAVNIRFFHEQFETCFAIAFQVFICIWNWMRSCAKTCLFIPKCCHFFGINFKQ